MGLGFLVPAFLAGVIALGVPVWVHLRNRPKTDTVEFPSLMFVERIPYRSVQKQQLRHRLLFAARCLALVLLVLAFARPFFGDDVAVTTVAGQREVVVLLDRSWSMGYEGVWVQAVEATRAEIEGLSGGDRLSLIAFDEQAEVLVESQPATAAAGILETLEPGHLATSYSAGLRAAARVLVDSALPATELVLISDFQRSGRDGDIEVSLPPHTVLRPVSVGPVVRANTSVADVVLERRLGDEGELLTVTARVTRQGGTEERSVPLSLNVDGEAVQRVPVTLPTAGAVRASFEPVPADGEVRVEVALPGDALAGDDTFRAVAHPGEALAVLVLDNPRGGGDDSLYLSRALGVGTRPSFRVTQQVLRDLRAEDLTDYDLVVLNDVADIDAGSADAVTRFVEAGGGLLVAWGELAPAGAGSSLLPLAAGDVIDRSAAQGGTFGFVDTSHVVFEAYRSPEAGDLTGARFYRYRQVVPPPTDGVLARFDDGSPALVELGLGAGRVLIWATTLDNFWTDLPLQPMFVPLAHEMAKYAAAFRPADAWVAAAPERVPGFVVEAGVEGERSVAVNLDRREADLAPVDPEELLAAVAFGNGAEVEAAAGEGPASARVEASQSLWWYLLVAAALLLLTEAALSNRLSPRASWTGSDDSSPPRGRTA